MLRLHLFLRFFSLMFRGDVAKTIECDVLESRIEEESLPVVVESRSSCPADRPGRRTDKTSHARDPCAKDKCLEEF